MKKVLVTGAAGTVGQQVLKYLLSEGKYEIAALDLKNNKSMQKLKKYKKRVNVIYGDVCNRVLIEALVKDFDICIHLASVTSVLGDLKKGLAHEIDFKGTENIVRAISYYNPDCHLFYPSAMALYKEKEDVTSQSAVKVNELDYYLKAKLESENLIKKKLKNYTIYRFPYLLSDFNESMTFDAKKNDTLACITKEDAAYSLVKGINYLKELNKKTFNVTSSFTLVYHDFIKKALRAYGLTWKYIASRLFLDKKDYPTSQDQKLNDIIHYQTSTLSDYYAHLKNQGKKRKVSRFITNLFVKEPK